MYRENDEIILCFSGGLDSMIAWYFMGKPKCIYFDCVNYSDAEKAVVEVINPQCIIDTSLNLRKFEEKENGYILHRNLLFAGIASNYGSTVVMAGLKDDMVPDKNPEAFDIMSKVLSTTSKKEIQVISPFWDKTKSDIVKWFLQYTEHAPWLLETSISCYQGTNCGRCPSCFRKACALFDNGIYTYFNNPILVHDYVVKAKAGYYEASRNQSILKYAATR